MRRSSVSGEGRARKMADRIQQILATTLSRGMKDPRLGFVTITEVRVTGDLQHATVFYTVLGDAQSVADSQAALDSAKGMLRSEVGRGITARLTPSLEFMLDAVPENASHIADLLNEAHMRDEQLRKDSQGSEYAGEADPYTKAEPSADADPGVGDR